MAINTITLYNWIMTVSEVWTLYLEVEHCMIGIICVVIVLTLVCVKEKKYFTHFLSFFLYAVLELSEKITIRTESLIYLKEYKNTN